MLSVIIRDVVLLIEHIKVNLSINIGISVKAEEGEITMKSYRCLLSCNMLRSMIIICCCHMFGLPLRILQNAVWEPRRYNGISTAAAIDVSKQPL